MYDLERKKKSKCMCISKDFLALHLLDFQLNNNNSKIPEAFLLCKLSVLLLGK